MDERFYYLGFSAFAGIGPIRFQKLLNAFGLAKTAWEAPVKAIQDAVGKKTGEDFAAFRDAFSIDCYLQKLKNAEVTFLTIIDNEYPALLKQIQKPPLVLFVKGNSSLLVHPSPQPSPARGEGNQGEVNYIAVVGTRNITQYGRQVTELLTKQLVNAGFIIVSGLALGVDALAHDVTVGSGGKTIAVLGCGVDCCNPTSNTYLYDKILASGGVIVSEAPLGQAPLPGSFPARNRIIAGLSQAVLVTEGAADSGSLITAEIAIKENRKVFAIPGPITSSLSVGPYKLLKQGATLVSTVEEIVQTLGIESIASTKGIEGKRGDTKEEQEILDLLQNEGLGFDEIVRKLGKNSAAVGSLLSLMEIKGFVKTEQGMIFAA